MASTAALRKAASVTHTGQTTTTNLLPYQPGIPEKSDSEHDVERSPAGWTRNWVLKYGGSSVGQRLPRVCESIFEHVLAGLEAGSLRSPVRVSVVVSAMGKTTDHLLDAAAAAQEGDLGATEEIVQRIHTLAVSNARQVFEHFKVPEERLQEALLDVQQVVEATLSGLGDYLKGVSLLRDLSPRTLDAILSNGERVSAAVVARVLAVVVAAGKARGAGGGLPLGSLQPFCVEAVNFMTTDDSFGKAKVDFVQTRERLHSLAGSWVEGALPIFTGFIGRSSQSGATTTLGRNGSDYSAAVIAAALGAERVIINTDVPGIFTADPRLVPDAFPVPEMSYDEAVELSIYGSKIFHPKTMLPLIKHGVPMVIRNTSDAPGSPSTMISSQQETAEPSSPSGCRRASVLRAPSIRRLVSEGDLSAHIKSLDGSTPDSPSDTPRARLERSRAADAEIGAVCIASLEDMSFITVRAEISENTASEVAARALQALEQSGLMGTWADQRAGSDASILVRHADRERAAETLIKEFKNERLLELSVTEPVTLLSLVPKQNASRVAAASRFFTALAKANVKIHRVVCGASTASISCLIDGQETSLAVRTAHNAFNFSKRVVSLVVLGANRTSRGLIEELYRRSLKPNRDLDIRVCAIIDKYGAVALSNGHTVDPKCGVPLQPEGMPLAEVLKDLGDTVSGQEMLWAERYQLAQNTVLENFRRLPTPVLVDCNRLDECSSAANSTKIALMSCYLSCLEAGVRLAVSNCGTMNAFATALRTVGASPPTPLASGTADEGAVATLQRRRALFRFDSAASAGPPLLETIRDLLRAGRRVGAVEGSLSGTLGVVLDRVSRYGDSLREAVETAHRMGITEPRISADLSGKDVVQKLRLVAFSLGCELADEDIAHQPLLPEEVLSGDAYDDSDAGRLALFEALQAFDEKEKFSEKARTGYKEGRRLRYVGKLELRGGGRATATIGVSEVDEEHFAFPIRGQEIVCALWESNRGGKAREDGEAESPMLVLRGQGAGKAAGEGVLSDIVQLVGI